MEVDSTLNLFGIVLFLLPTIKRVKDLSTLSLLRYFGLIVYISRQLYGIDY